MFIHIEDSMYPAPNYKLTHVLIVQPDRCHLTWTNDQGLLHKVNCMGVRPNDATHILREIHTDIDKVKVGDLCNIEVRNEYTEYDTIKEIIPLFIDQKLYAYSLAQSCIKHIEDYVYLLCIEPYPKGG
jgi:hypothetical protein